MAYNNLSAEAEELLAYAFEQGGQSPVVFTQDAVFEVVRAGMAELVTIGVDEPFVTLTPAGLKRCRSAVPVVPPVPRTIVPSPA